MAEKRGLVKFIDSFIHYISWTPSLDSTLEMIHLSKIGALFYLMEFIICGEN